MVVVVVVVVMMLVQTSISESKIEREGERALLIKGILIITFISEYKDALHAPPAGKRELIIFFNPRHIHHIS